MAILLTGGAGFIGTHTCVSLLASGYDIIVVDDYANSTPEAIARVKKLTGRDFPVYNVDVCDRSALREVFHAEKIDAVIHFAGYKAVSESIEKPLLYYKNNLISTINLIETMEAFSVRRLVFSSSATVYGDSDQAEMREDMPTGCKNPYGWTKYMIEQILRDVAYADDRWSIALLRYFNPVGAHESGRIGEDPNGIPNNLMPRVMRNALGIIPVLGVYGDDYPTPDGTCIRDYIHVVDLADGHVKALRFLWSSHGCEAINLGTGVGYSVLDILHTFERANHVKLTYQIEPRRAGDAAACYANPEKAAKLLGWRANKTLENMCRDAWRWQTMNPHGYHG